MRSSKYLPDDVLLHAVALVGNHLGAEVVRSRTGGNFDHEFRCALQVAIGIDLGLAASSAIQEHHRVRLRFVFLVQPRRAVVGHAALGMSATIVPQPVHDVGMWFGVFGQSHG